MLEPEQNGTRKTEKDTGTAPLCPLQEGKSSSSTVQKSPEGPEGDHSLISYLEIQTHPQALEDCSQVWRRHSHPRDSGGSCPGEKH